MSSIMRRRNGLIASSVMGMLLSDVRLGTPHLKTGRPVALSSWLCRQPQRPTARAVSSFDPERTSSLIGFRDQQLTQAGATEAFQIVLPVRVVLDRYLVRDPGKRDIRLRAAKLL